jgi:hypothetical protein
MANLEAEQKRVSEARKKRVKRSGLRVVESGQDQNGDDSGESDGDSDKPKWLN